MANSNTTTIWGLDSYIDLSGMWLGLDLRKDTEPQVYLQEFGLHAQQKLIIQGSTINLIRGIYMIIEVQFRLW
jgi:hypothetical protein